MLCLPSSGPLPVATPGALAPALADFSLSISTRCSRLGLHGTHDWDTLLRTAPKMVGLWFGATWPGLFHIGSCPHQACP